MLAEYQDSIEQFVRIASNLKRSRMSWMLEKGFKVEIMSEEALEEPCLSVTRATAFVPFLYIFASSRWRWSWARVGEDLFSSIYREAILLRHILMYMDTEASRILFSTSLGASIGFALVSPIKHELHAKLHRLLKCDVGPRGVEGVVTVTYPYGEGLPLYYISLFGLASLAMTYFSTEEPLSVLTLGHELFESIENYLREGRYFKTFTDGSIRVDKNNINVCFRGECVNLRIPKTY